jgi:hypothetical protein
MKALATKTYSNRKKQSSFRTVKNVLQNAESVEMHVCVTKTYMVTFTEAFWESKNRNNTATCFVYFVPLLT